MYKDSFREQPKTYGTYAYSPSYRKPIPTLFLLLNGTLPSQEAAGLHEEYHRKFPLIKMKLESLKDAKQEGLG